MTNTNVKGNVTKVNFLLIIKRNGDAFCLFPRRPLLNFVD